ncbi:MAG TPA: hypothetical protein VGI39_23460 [Polyangiaceae bacterium]
MTRSTRAGIGAALVMALALTASGVLVACGGSSASSKGAAAAPPPASAAAPASSPSTGAATAGLRRSAVRAVVAGGLGAFLQHVELDDQPAMKDGRFLGFRLARLRDPGFWRGVDLHPGDVIVRVNGMPIEHPEEALEVFRSLDSASELRVEYERDGKPKELRYPIVNDVPAAGSGRADASAP